MRSTSLKPPAIGDRVAWPGNRVVGPCLGVIENLWPAHQPGTRVALPVSEWYVSIRPDERPALWAYGSAATTFGARVGDLRKASSR